MTDILNLDAEREKRDGPDAENVFLDPMTGEKWYRFTASYEIDDDEFSIDFWALDQADAERRLAVMNGGLTYTGQMWGTFIPSL